MNTSDRPSGQQSSKIDIPYLINYFQPSSDVKLRPFAAGMESGHAITLIYCEPMTDLKQLNEVIYPRLADLCRDQANLEIDELGRNPYLPLNRIEESDLLHHLTLQVYSGKLVLYFEHNQTFFSCDISNPPGRSPEEASTESAVKGARDGRRKISILSPHWRSIMRVAVLSSMPSCSTFLISRNKRGQLKRDMGRFGSEKAKGRRSTRL
ncbi:spore germination protein [Paenibacillus sp. oral taxon 786]|uniref:spore germination protein n=1 Tax=Paenibacillus sp. oral taxon 786 TaxID=652715 RepID=UPI001E5A71CB|nr:spore germination protein [Paenibacillus sp. oral taxon 786]